MKLECCWIEKQEQPLCFSRGSPSALQISSFTSSRLKIKEEKVRPS
jgi:hypothetical protein